MPLRCLSLVLCLLGSASLTAQVPPPTGAWRQANVTRKKPPAELELKQRLCGSGSPLLWPRSRFILVYATVIKGALEAISGGDGHVVYFGTWKLEGGTLPGPVQREDVRVKDTRSCSKRIASEGMRS